VIVSFLDRLLKRYIEAEILRLYKTGSIDVTVRHVTETKLRCAACGGSGKGLPVQAESKGLLTPEASRQILMACQGICLSCEGSGVVR
jgi:hypothetical protein